MTSRLEKIQPAMAYASSHLDEDVSLATLASQTGISPFHLQKLFTATASESPKQFTLRLRLARAAAMLLTGDDTVLDIALACGFQTHESFTRAFRKKFGMAPSAYRVRGFAENTDASQAKSHAAFASQIAPCLALHHLDREGNGGATAMAYSITKTKLAPQPVLVIRRRIKPADVAKTLASALGQIFMHAQQKGFAIAGQPFTRYIEWGPGIWTIEAGLPIASPGASAGEIKADTLPGGPAATTIHMGSYDGLSAAHAALQQWVEEQKLTPAGAPWEVYTIDPADYPDPKDWRTDLFWPLAG
jgi:AraC family transcriptional regulator